MTIGSAAARMDRMYRHQRHVYDFTRKYYLLGRDRLIARLAVGAGERVLEIGCGTGRNLIATARRYPEACVVGVDISAAMLDTARQNLVRAGLAGRITLIKADACVLDATDLFGAARFDRVFASYSLSMIPTWYEALARAIHLLAPTGELHVVDFGRQENWPVAPRSLLRRWLALFDVVPPDDLESALRSLTDGRTIRSTVASLYGGYAAHAIVRSTPTTLPG